MIYLAEIESQEPHLFRDKRIKGNDRFEYTKYFVDACLLFFQYIKCVTYFGREQFPRASY